MSQSAHYTRYWRSRLAFHYRRKLFRMLRRNRSIWRIPPTRAFTSYQAAWGEMLTSATRFDGPWVSEVEYYCRLEPLLNRVEASDEAADKNTYDRSSLADAVVPAIINYVRGRWFETATYSPISEESARDLIRQFETVVIKPSRSSGGGAGVEVLRTSDLKLAAPLSRPYDYVVQSAVVSSEWYQKWNRASVNTLRIMTLRDSDRLRLASALLRFGAPGKTTDNLRSGGRAIGVRDGILAPYTIDVNLRRSDRLPDGTPLQPERVPGFSEAVDLCLQKHRSLMAFDVVSWDIAFSDSGKPLILELNLSSQGISSHQAANGPVLECLRAAAQGLKGIRG